MPSATWLWCGLTGLEVLSEMTWQIPSLSSAHFLVAFDFSIVTILRSACQQKFVYASDNSGLTDGSTTTTADALDILTDHADKGQPFAPIVQRPRQPSPPCANCPTR
jgi:hypothetical protein